MDKATRRHHEERMKKRARRIYPDMRCPERLANHLANCSCWMCGNPRRRFKGKARLTVQERRALTKGEA